MKPVCQSARSLSIQRHQYQACLSECQVSLHSETSVSSLSVRVPGLSPFRDISIKPVCQSVRSLSIQRHQYQACLSECQVSLHSETSVSSLSVRVLGLCPFRDISIKPVCQSARSLSIQRHKYQACLVSGLCPFRDLSIKPVCQSARSLSIQRHQYQACLSECQVSVHSETSVSSLSVRVPGLCPFRDISIKPVLSSLSVRVPGLSPFRDICIKPVCQCQVSVHSETSV
uniref:Uncharacterized protein n=1 Tax=Oncorhynchus mykiss TaxID=8022 RepID=A0A8K9XDI2_ONCMY